MRRVSNPTQNRENPNAIEFWKENGFSEVPKGCAKVWQEIKRELPQLNRHLQRAELVKRIKRRYLSQEEWHRYSIDEHLQQMKGAKDFHEIAEQITEALEEYEKEVKAKRH